MGDLLYCVTSLLTFDDPLYLHIYINRSSSITCCRFPGGMNIFFFCISNKILVVFSVCKNVIFLLGVVSAALCEAVPVILSEILLPIKSLVAFADF